MAGGAGLGAGAVGTSGAVTLAAVLHHAHGDLFLYAKGCFFKGDLHLGHDVLALLRRVPPCGGAAAEAAEAAEEVSEDVAQVAEVKSASGAAGEARD